MIMKKLLFLVMLTTACCFSSVAEPFPAEKLAGVWKMSKSYVVGSSVELDGRIAAVLSFIDNGKCRISVSKRIGGNVDHPHTCTQSYEYKDGVLRFFSVIGGKKSPVRIPCLNASHFELKAIDEDSFEMRYADLSEYDQFSGFANTNRRSQYNADGTLEVKKTSDAGGVKRVSTEKHPPMIFRRVKSLMSDVVVKEDSPIFRILSLQKEEGGDVGYRFKLEMLDETGGKLNAYRRVQHEFSALLREEVAKTFKGDPRTLFLAFPTFKLNGMMVEGRAVALVMKPLSLSYNPTTRRGQISISLAANQFNVARRFARGTIEALARYSNIVVKDGEIPPAAKFYLGREEVKDGNVLEIEFMTE